MFVDEATLSVQGGDGGNGCSSFRREKFVPRGGPDGGDGGNGGSVLLYADRSTTTLLQFRQRTLFRGERGQHGLGANKTGRSGADLRLRVPVGTLVFDADGTRVLADLSAEGREFVAAAGGRHGRGNSRFTSSRQRAPTRAEPGAPGEQRKLRLELKLLADVGLLGFPNAGKSTLISRVSSARPKIAAYPFTTLEPKLGVVDLGDYRSFVMADIPGLIEGSHQGAGLGHRFLRHVERCRLLLHLVDVGDGSRDPVEGIRTLDGELRLYRSELAGRPQIIVVSKADTIQESAAVERVRQFAAEAGRDFYIVSSVTGNGIPELIRGVAGALAKLPPMPNDERADEDSDPAEAVGVVGGTFDPVHLGHLQVAGQVRERFGFRRMLIVPTAVPPHKSAEQLTPVAHRVAMLRLALEESDGLELSSLELDESRVCYTIDTLRTLRDEQGYGPLFVMGMDSLLDIESWHEYRQLIEEFDLIVIDRPGRELTEIGERLSPRVIERIVRLGMTAEASAGLAALRPGTGGRIFHIGIDPIPISASEIRRRTAAGKEIGHLVPESVAEYILNSGLYREEESR